MDITTILIIIIRVSTNTIAVVINALLFHRLETLRQSPDLHQHEHLQHHWWGLWSSLSIAHIVNCSCMFAPIILTLVMQEYMVISKEIIHSETFILMLSIVLTMLHLVSIMVNDYYGYRKIKYYPNASSLENKFFIAVSWITVMIIAIVLTFFGAGPELVTVMCVVFLTCDVFMLGIYVIIHLRRSTDKQSLMTLQYSKEKEEGEEEEKTHLVGTSIVLCFVALTVPFSLEKLIWKQNGLVSFCSVMVNSIVYGSVSLFWVRGRLRSVNTNGCKPSKV